MTARFAKEARREHRACIETREVLHRYRDRRVAGDFTQAIAQQVVRRQPAAATYSASRLS